MLKVKHIGRFERMVENLVVDDFSLSSIIKRRINLFTKNPDDTRLANHALRKHLKGKWAFSITGDIRIVYEWIGTSSVRFLAIGAHKKVYPQNKNK